MPRRAGRPCRAPGCTEVVQDGAYCTTHQPERKREDDRASASQRGYGATWRRLRLMVLRRHSICADPFGMHHERVVLATDVDHIVARRDGGQDIESNLQALCHACHSRKTASGL